MTRSRRQRAAPRHHGQALPLGVFFLFASVAVMYLMFNTGQLVDEKIKTTNAADAAAYSAGTLEARVLNYDAYVNRTMVANEVAIAQAVSMEDWVNYYAQSVYDTEIYASQIVPGTGWIYDLGAYPQLVAIGAVLAGSAYVDGYTGGAYLDDLLQGTGYTTAGLVTASDVAVQLLSASEDVLHVSTTLGASQWELAKQVVHSIDGDLSAEVVETSYDFDNFTQSYSGDQRGRFADVTMRSRDAFTQQRNWTLNGPDIPFIQNNVSMRKRGGTDLIGYDEWRGVDTLATHGQTFGCGKFGLSWCGDTEVPIGWGGAEADNGEGDQGRGYHGNSYNDNPSTSANADGAMVSMTDEFYAVFHGLPSARDVSNLDPAATLTTGITIRVTKPRNKLRTSGGSSIIQPTGRLAQFGASAPGDVMTALSRAEVFFSRPALRADQATEIGSLYNPYWQVHLISPTTGDKAYAAAFQGGMALP
jgi:hypothetical protein